MKRITLFFAVAALSLLLVVKVSGQTKKDQDRKAIKSMCGCYEVGFNFAETFSYSKDSTYQPSKVKHDRALEWVELVEDGADKIVLQHLLIVGPPSKRSIIKHWRQDWLYENTDLYVYDLYNKWKFVKKSKAEVAGQWTQKVFQVDDSPRYEGSASWVHIDGKSYWENQTDAPLPRREYTKRHDYNVTFRRNRHEITSRGWIHDQDNDKIIRQAGKSDFILAQEKGLNTYTKVDNSKCKIAQDWWQDNKVLWKAVRNKWQTVFERHTNLELATKVEDKRLYEHLFSLKPTTADKAVAKIINSFVK